MLNLRMGTCLKHVFKKEEETHVKSEQTSRIWRIHTGMLQHTIFYSMAAIYVQLIHDSTTQPNRDAHRVKLNKVVNGEDYFLMWTTDEFRQTE
jgi:hypothetical protein